MPGRQYDRARLRSKTMPYSVAAMVLLLGKDAHHHHDKTYLVVNDDAAVA